MQIQENVNLNNLTTFKIGGMARYFVEVKDENDLKEVFVWINNEQLRYVIIAGGSNVLLNSNPFDGVVIRIMNNDLTVRGDRLECGAGSFLSKSLTMAMKESLTGLEWAAGIPGSIGGAVRGNAGAYGGQMADAVEVVEIYNLEKGKMEIMSNKDCKFGYRDSIFKKEGNKYIIWKIFLKLKKGDSAEMQKIVNEYIDQRVKKQPRLPNAGCIFKNFDAEFIKAENAELYEVAVEQNIIKGGKIAAGWIIDQLDLRGKKVGDAKISLEHANFMVNTGSATAEDIIMLISFVKQKVRSRFKIQLNEEIQYLGF